MAVPPPCAMQRFPNISLLHPLCDSLLLGLLPTVLCTLDAALAPRCSALPGQCLTLGMQVSLHG